MSTDWILECWTAQFRAAFQMMTLQELGARWEPAQSQAPESLLIWQQSYSGGPGAVLEVGAPPAAWSEFGTRILNAAGADLIDQAEARGTYLELVQQSLSALTRDLAAKASLPVEATSGKEADGWSGGSMYTLTFSLEGAELSRLYFLISDGMMKALQPPAKPSLSPPPKSQLALPDLQTVLEGGPMDRVLDLEMPVSICLGRAEIPLKEVLKLTGGSVVELDRMIDDPVEILVNNRVVARGDIVAIEGNYGVKIREVISAQQRLALRTAWRTSPLVRD